jgi:hypothetical protein
MEDGRQGMAGNGHTSRVWKGDGKGHKADTSNTGFGFFLPITPPSSQENVRNYDGG